MNYVLMSLALIAAILAVFAIALYIRSKYMRSYEKKFQEAFKADSNNDFNKAIKKYEDVIKGADENNPILINTFLLLAKAYHEKGSENDVQALELIDKTISLLQNNKVNQQEAYIKQALFYKADFLSQINQPLKAAALFKDIQIKYAGDSILQKKISQKLAELVD